jgi:hypothetical protein
MSASLPLPSGDNLNLGDPFRMLGIFAEMSRLLPESEIDHKHDTFIRFGELFGVSNAVLDNLDTEDIEAGWYEDVKRQARLFLREYGKSLSRDGKRMLKALSRIQLHHTK